MMSSINFPNIEVTGRYFNKGVVSCWVRLPSGFQHAHTKRTIFHLTLWEKIELYDITDSNTLVEELRPTHISAFFQGHGRKDDWSESPSVASTYFAVSSYNTPQGYWWSDVAQTSDILHNNLLRIDYPSTTADTTSPPQTWAMLHPTSEMWFPGFPPPPPTPWEGFWEDPLDSKLSLMKPRAATDFWQAEAGDPYTYRPGGWVKVVCAWDLNNYATDRAQISGLLAQGGAGTNNFNTMQTIQLSGFAFPPSEHWYGDENSWNSRMILSLGEKVQYRTGQDDVQPSPFWGQDPDVRSHFSTFNTTALPTNRLNSIIDDFQIYTSYNSGLNEGTMKAMLEGSSPGYANRYNLTTETLNGSTEPRWTINPGLPTNSRLLTVRSRIYDVPYDSELGEPVDIAWPKIDIEVEQNTVPLVSYKSVTTTVDGKVRTSPSSLHFSSDQVDSNLRIKFIWKAETPWGDAISHPKHVFDAPWIEDVMVDYYVGDILVQKWIEK